MGSDIVGDLLEACAEPPYDSPTKQCCGDRPRLRAQEVALLFEIPGGEKPRHADHDAAKIKTIQYRGARGCRRAEGAATATRSWPTRGPCGRPGAGRQAPRRAGAR